jgi:hypothetical protein
MMLDLSVFAVSLVVGWSAFFKRWPDSEVRRWTRPLVMCVWSGWAVVAALLVWWAGLGWGLVGAGIALGLAGHAMMVFRMADRGQ